jgi:hypothetical protein
MQLVQVQFLLLFVKMNSYFCFLLLTPSGGNAVLTRSLDPIFQSVAGCANLATINSSSCQFACSNLTLFSSAQVRH